MIRITTNGTLRGYQTNLNRSSVNLSQTRDKVLTQRHLLLAVWGPNAVEHTHYLRIYMGHLRQKLEADPARPQYLLTETGVGYRFNPA